MTTIILPIDDYAIGWVDVSATIVNVAPHLWPWTFAAHLSISGFPSWTVSNIETGRLVVYREKRCDAIYSARMLLEQHTPASIEAAVMKLPASARE